MADPEIQANGTSTLEKLGALEPRPEPVEVADVRDATTSIVNGDTSNSIKRKVNEAELEESDRVPKRKPGVAQIKAEYLLPPQAPTEDGRDVVQTDAADDDAAEAFHHEGRSRDSNQKKGKKWKKQSGQNKARSFGSSTDEITLCQSRAHYPEFSPQECSFGTRCKFEHDLRKYLNEYKREDLTSFNGVCPIWDAKGYCNVGWKCRFVGSHMKERETEDGKMELVLLEDEDRKEKFRSRFNFKQSDSGTVNTIPTADKTALLKKKFRTEKADKMNQWIEAATRQLDAYLHTRGGHKKPFSYQDGSDYDSADDHAPREPAFEERAKYVEPPMLPSEKRRLYFGPETPVLAPLTTQGNQPFRRLCTGLGAQFTYSEMAMSIPVLQGQRSEWALMKAHESEVAPPTFTSKSNIVTDYDQSKDLRFGAQIASNKPWSALKATEILTTLLPGGLRCVDLNCGCPIDLVFREGAGSALMDHPSKLEKMLRGMNTVSGEVPITVKIRTGTRDGKPTASKLVKRLIFGGHESHEMKLDPCGVAAITLHGRSRQQRYTRSADWTYISECASMIKSMKSTADSLADTIREPDPRTQPVTNSSKSSSTVQTPYFLGNGDCYSHLDYHAHCTSAGVDSVMVARGALQKPWLFEEIASNQYLDKSATERLGYIEQFVRYGLEAWGSDEMGVGTTRRFLLEWLSFSCRYVPIGLLEVLPPRLQDRPPRWKGRNELEELLGSGNYMDWIKIRYVLCALLFSLF